MSGKVYFVLMVVGLALGLGGWWGYRNFTQPQTQSLPVDALVDQSFDQEQVTKVSGRRTQPAPLNAEETQDPFFAEPTYFSTFNTSFLEHVQTHTGVYQIVPLYPSSEVIKPVQTSYAFSRMVGQPDQVQAYLLKTHNLPVTDYARFLRELRKVSLEQQIHPAVAYALYDSLALSSQAINQDYAWPPISELIPELHQAHTRFLSSTKTQDITEVAEQFPHWSQAGLAVAYALRWHVEPDALVQAYLSEGGVLDQYYTQRFATEETSPWEVKFLPNAVAESEYRQGQLNTRLAVCQQQQAYLCGDIQPGQGAVPGSLQCQPASFLNDFCDLIINL